jgi:hypothetical protein
VIFSQVACINHLEPARLNRERALSIARKHLPGAIDAVMAVRRDNGTICLFVIEWKYTESYGSCSLAVSKHSTSRVEIYRALLERADSPIRLGEHERLFFDPFDQLMRQTSLALQMVEHKEFGATEWLHLHVAPAANVALLGTVTSPQLAEFGNMESAWRSVLVQPERNVVVAPEAVTPDVAAHGEWREWLGGVPSENVRLPLPVRSGRLYFLFARDSGAIITRI